MVAAYDVREYAEWERVAYLVRNMRGCVGEKRPPSVTDLIGERPDLMRGRQIEPVKEPE